MLPLRIVVDTNIMVSAVLKPDGLQRTVLTIALAKPARLYVSAAILSEYESVMSRVRLRILAAERRRLMRLLWDRAHLVTPRYRIRSTSDPDDNIFLECADAARADYLVTGNLRHFPGFWKYTKVVSSRDFIGIAAPHLLP